MPKKNVLMEVPAELAEMVKRLMKLDELNARMADGKEPVDWGSVSGDLEATMRSGEVEFSRRLLQRHDESAKCPTSITHTHRRQFH